MFEDQQKEDHIRKRHDNGDREGPELLKVSIEEHGIDRPCGKEDRGRVGVPCHGLPAVDVDGVQDDEERPDTVEGCVDEIKHLDHPDRMPSRHLAAVRSWARA